MNATTLTRAAVLLGALALSSAALADDGKQQPPKLPPEQKPPPAAPAPRDDSPEAKRARASAAASARLDAAREAYGFASWPGKEGATRDGIDLAALGKLEETAAKAPRVDLCALPGDPVAKLVAAEGSVRALVWVEESPKAAQEKLLSWLAASTGKYLRLADKAALGDVALQGGDGEVASIAFARGNVTVVVTAPVKLAQPLARRIDRLASESTPVDEKHPRTVAEGKLSRSTEVGESGISYGRYELTGSGFVWRDARADGGHVTDESRSTFWVTADAGHAGPLKVHLLSPRGWRTTITSD